jgi:predicted DNA-binding transcriptional regulator AlpA
MAQESLLTLPELAREAQVPLSWLYERSRRDALPGQRRLGKYVRVVREEFFRALKDGRVR